jgi:hypothetical protein
LSFRTMTRQGPPVPDPGPLVCRVVSTTAIAAGLYTQDSPGFAAYLRPCGADS